MHDVEDAPVPDPDAELALAAPEQLGSGWPGGGGERLDPMRDAAPCRGVESGELSLSGWREGDPAGRHHTTVRVRASPSPTG